MKTLTQYINEWKINDKSLSNVDTSIKEMDPDRMLNDLNEILTDESYYGKDPWKNCSIVSFADMVHVIKNIIKFNADDPNNFKIAPIGKLKKEKRILVASYNNNAHKIAELLEEIIDNECLFNDDKYKIYHGINVQAYLESFYHLDIIGVSNVDEEWTFFIVSDKIKV